MQEEWKLIDKGNSNSNKYSFAVSNFGRVKILGTNERPSKVYENKEGYLSVKVHGKRKRIHRLVYEYFGSDFREDYHIHHIDGDKKNNDIRNLEMITPSDHNRLHHKTNNFNRYTRGYVLSETERSEIANKYRPYKYTAPMLAKEYNISEETVKRIVREFKEKS